MANFLSLSAELKLSIVEQLDLASTSFIPGPSADILSLSRVCKVLRAIAAPFLFKDLTLLNDEKNGSSVLAVFDSTWAEHVRSMHYIGVMAMPSYEVVEDGLPCQAPSPEDLPSPAKQALCSLNRLPNLERVIVEFRCDRSEKEEQDIYESTFENLEEPESDDEIVKSEAKYAYRSLMEQSYTALSQNPASTIKNLELRNNLAKGCSSWKTDAFQALLGGLSSFSMSLRGGDNGAGWQINTVAAYLAYIESLDARLFQHLQGVKHFGFSATTDGPPGLEGGMNNTSLPLHTDHMPELTSLELQHVFISKELATFIAEHGQTLARIRLNDCYSGLDDNNCTDEGIALSWGDFFSTIADHKMAALCTFEIAPSYLETVEVPKHGAYRHEFAKRVKEVRENSPERRMLDYKIVDDKYGMLFDSDLGLEKFEEAADQAGWEKLCAVLERNNKQVP